MSENRVTEEAKTV